MSRAKTGNSPSPESEAQRRLELVEQALLADGRYPLVAYDFLHRGLQRATLRVHGPETPNGGPRHVTGPELCYALRDLAFDTWGLMALPVLHHWRIYRTRDFGEMVFLLVKLGLMGARPTDRIEDFDDVFEFEEAFADYPIVLPSTKAVADGV
jgi:uncharacterized repeat protein (TIGR04138 family)